jgi:MoaA/NifB/PqqE/SkfB family radical SAM enzyme
MKLEQIGFYTLSDERAQTASATSRLQRCELILTGGCNFNCPYCRHIGGPHLPFARAAEIVSLWAKDGLRCIRFSGGEPTLWPWLKKLVSLTWSLGVERIAISTNGSATTADYNWLMKAGIDDFSVSLDACCAADGDRMAGGRKGSWQRVTKNIRYLASKVYTTVGVVLTADNLDSINGIIQLADDMGVSDIRLIPAAQFSDHLEALSVDEKYLSKYPILRYRYENIKSGRGARGIGKTDSHRCGLAMDDIAVMGDKHYPCIIYLRESGNPIGSVGPNMRVERAEWSSSHNTDADPICRANCLDVCVDYNNRVRDLTG